MDGFKVKLGPVRSSAEQKRQIVKELSSVRDELSSIKSSLRFKVGQRERIDRRLTQETEALGQHKGKMEQVASVLSSIAELYEQTETALSGGDVNNKQSSVKDILKENEVTNKPSDGFVVGVANSIINNLIKGELDSNTIYKDIRNDVRGWKDSHSDKLYQSKTQWDTETGAKTQIDPDNEAEDKQFNQDLKDTKIEKDVTISKVGDSVSLSSGKVIAGDENGTHASAEYSLGKAEANAELYAGLLKTDPVTGKKVFRPGIGVSVGTSVTGFTATEKAQLGSSMLGAYVSSTQTIGRVGVKGDASIGAYDANGKFTPSAYVGASAEAIGGEITGKVGGKVLGTDIGVQGSLNYGIGAHLNAGFKDGKVSLDIGATLGVGASVKLEIDVSGTIDAVCDGAAAVWNGITSWFK